MKKVFLKLIGILNLMIFVTLTFSQVDTVYVVSDAPISEGNLNRAIEAIIQKGTLSNTLFMLEKNGYYVMTDSILIPSGENLTIIAPEPGTTQQAAPPQLLWRSRTDSDKKHFFVSYGNLILRNVWILSMDTEGNKIASSIIFKQNNKLNKQQCKLENVMFDSFTYSPEGNGTITIACENFTGEFKNCYWKNCANEFLTHQGKAVSFHYKHSGLHIDSLLFENCTFANIGLVYEQQGSNYADYVKFNHCTFLNIVKSPFQSGAWYKLVLTNNLFINSFMYGYIPDIDEYKPSGGIFKIDSVANFDFDVQFADNDRKILFANNNYYIENWLAVWMKNNPYSLELLVNKQYDLIPEPQPILNRNTETFFKSSSFPFISMNNIDSLNPNFILPPSDTTSIKQFLFYRWSNIGATQNWAWKHESSIHRLWPLEENLAYSNSTLLTAGMGEFPLGDLYHWFPERYTEWKAQKEFEDERIATWLETGKDPVVGINEEYKIRLPFDIRLFQNYPNPFNPTTVISYQLPEKNFVTIKVYDILGREITTLVNEYKEAGNYKVEFSADKYQLSSGVYFYTLKAGKNYVIKKMMLIK
jgi:hypothetical protein